MKLSTRVLLLVAYLTLASLARCQSPSTSNAFVENKGQWNSKAQFLATTPGMNLWFTSEGIVMDLRKFTRNYSPAANPKMDRPAGTTDGQILSMSFVEGKSVKIDGMGLQKAYFNYIRPSSLVQHVRRYESLQTQDIYEGISARYYFDNGAPRYDLIVRPGADPSQIALRIDGANGVAAQPSGDLSINTTLGVIEQKGLAVYQGEQVIPSKMVLDGDTLRFDLGAYDQTKPLVIDPLIYSSFIGGSGDAAPGDSVRTVTAPFTLNGSKYQYIAGDAQLFEFPTTNGAWEDQGEEGFQGFVAQIASANGTLSWCTFVEGAALGSSATCDVNGAAADAYGNAIVGGSEYNETFPTTFGAYQSTTKNANVYSGFFAKISGDGTTLMNSTLLSCATGDTIVNAICLASTGAIMATGQTKATDFPTTYNALGGANGSANNGQAGTAFISEISSDFTTLQVGSYLGGSGSEVGNAIADGIDDDFVVAGSTTSANFPIGSDSFQPQNNAGSGGSNAFVDDIHFKGWWVVGGSYLGGSGSDQAYAVYLDPVTGYYVVAGATTSSDFPATAGSYQTTLNGNTNGFVAVIFYSWDSLISATYFGGSGSDAIYAMVYGVGGPIVAGKTTSSNLPVSAACYQPGLSTPYGAFLAYLPGLSSVAFCSYYGNYTNILGMAPDLYGNLVIGGTGGYVPATESAFQSTNNATGASTTGFYADISPTAETLAIGVGAKAYTGGAVIPGSLTLSSVAPLTGAAVVMKSDNVNAQVQSGLLVPSDNSAAGFTVSTTRVSAATLVNIYASYNGANASASFTLLPNAISKLVFSPSKVVGGQIATGTVTLAGPSGSVPMTVTLQSGSASKVEVPPSMKIAANVTSGTFTATTAPVSAASVVTIKATNGANSLSGALEVLPATVYKVAVTPTVVTGTFKSTGTVTLTGNAGPGGDTVSVTSANITIAQTPVSVPVAAGHATATFTITTKSVNTNTHVLISATYNGTTQSATLTVYTAPLSAVTVAPASVTGGNPSTGTVTLGAPAGSSGTTVKLDSLNMGLATVPVSVLVPAGQTKATFTVKTTQVLSNSSVTIGAAVGAGSRSASLTLMPDALSSFLVSPSTVTGGTNASAKVTLAGPITFSAIFVNLTTSNAAAAKPQYAQVDVGTPGQSSASFAIYSYPVSTSQSVTLTASYNGISKVQALIVNPASLAAISVYPASVVGGKTATGTVTLTGPAGPSGTTVTLLSSSLMAKVPASVKVLPGKSSTQFSVATAAVSKSIAVTLTAQWNSLSRTAVLTLAP